ncbi:hypothetical protein C8Q79DRAFT_719987 [Trametes meyenii]|nr:hypothetical protein C8Q79DRAFT_719987 [Trametes meyenii]
MYYPQQSPGIAHKLPTHQHPGQVHDQSPWGRHPGYGPANGAQPPTSPAYPLFAHANGTMTAMQHHPHQPMHGALAHHHHHNSLTHQQFSSPPNGNGLQGPHGTLGQTGSPGPISTQMMTPHWQQQLLKCEVRLRRFILPYKHHGRHHPSVFVGADDSPWSSHHTYLHSFLSILYL